MTYPNISDDGDRLDEEAFLRKQIAVVSLTLTYLRLLCGVVLERFIL